MVLFSALIAYPLVLLPPLSLSPPPPPAFSIIPSALPSFCRYHSVACPPPCPRSLFAPWCVLLTVVSSSTRPPQSSLQQRGLVLHFPGTKGRPALKTVASAGTGPRWKYTRGFPSICPEYHDALGTRGCVFTLQWACPQLSWLCGVWHLSRGSSPHLRQMKSQMQLPLAHLMPGV